MEGAIPPTDSRLRPDIRAMENGDIGTVYKPWYKSLLCHSSFNTLWWYSGVCNNARLYRSGKRGEEKTWGKTENGPEKPQ